MGVSRRGKLLQTFGQSHQSILTQLFPLWVISGLGDHFCALPFRCGTWTLNGDLSEDDVGRTCAERRRP